MAGKTSSLTERYVTDADRNMRAWHLLLRRTTFGAALALMGASVVSLHWACTLIGLPGPVGWVVPLAIEVGMASVASAAATIRKPNGRYHAGPASTFLFLMLLAQAANIGHAIVVASGRLSQLPTFVPPGVVYGFAAAFAALFPLGGTLLVHVSAFLREHGTGATWIDEQAEVVYVETTTAKRPARTRRPATPSTPTAGPAKQPRNADAQARARECFDTQLAANPGMKPDAARIRTAAGLEHLNAATIRRWVSDWYATTQQLADLEITAQPHNETAAA